MLFLNLGRNTNAKAELVRYLLETKGAYHYFEYLGYWEFVITFSVKSLNEMEDIKDRIITKFSNYVQDHEILWIDKRHKIEPYPDPRLVYPKT